jgi:hypothetical protein
VQIFFSAFLVGITTWIVAQILAVPLRPIDLRAAFKKAETRWKAFAGTVTVSTLLAFLGLLFCVVPGIWLSARFMLITPSIMMEGLSGKKAFRRSAELVKRAYRTVLATAILVYIVPGALAFIIGISTGAVVKSFFPNETNVVGINNNSGKNFGITITPDNEKHDKAERKAIRAERVMSDKIKESISGMVFGIFWVPLNILITSFTSVVTALLYFKTRLAGGESMNDLLEQFEESDRPKSNWQKRVGERLIQSGRVTSRST